MSIQDGALILAYDILAITANVAALQNAPISNATYANTAGSALVATTANIAVTQPLTDNSTNIATTAFVNSTLTAANIASKTYVISYVANAIANSTPTGNATYANTAGSALVATTANIAITRPYGDNSTNIATTAFVVNAVANANTTQQWTAGNVSSVGSNLTLANGVLSASGGGNSTQQWTAGNVSTLGSNLTLANGVLSASGGSSSGNSPQFFLPANPAFANISVINASSTCTITADVSNSISIVDSGTNAAILEGISTPVPSATPYRVALLTYHTGISAQYICLEFGWRNSSGAFHTYSIVGGNNSDQVETWNSSTSRGTFSSVATNISYGGNSTLWLGLRDDGTNVYWEYSFDSVNFITVYQVAKSSGFLGSTGYSNIFVGFSPIDGYTEVLAIRTIDFNGLTRTFPTAGSGGGSGSIGKYSATIGDGANTTYVVTHNLGTQDIAVSLRQSASPFAIVASNSAATSTTTATISFATAPASGAYRVTIIG